jgi:D-lyxose ketol-isomerase
VYDVRKALKPALPFRNKGEILEYHETLLKHRDRILNNLKKITLKKGDQFRLKPFMAHKFRAKTSGAVILEVSTTHFEEDSYRITKSRALDVGEYDPGYF